MDIHENLILNKIILYKKKISDIRNWLDNNEDDTFGCKAVEIAMKWVELKIAIEAEDGYQNIINEHYGDNND